MSAAALFILTSIVAQTSLAQASPSAAPPKSASATTAPVATGAPHMCADYPIGAMQAAAEGTTMVGFQISETGTVANVGVKTSSGNADLDSASVACTKTWQYKPATMNGAPVAVPWQVAVKWQIRPSPPFDAISDIAYRCVLLTDAGRDEMSKTQLRPVVRVHFQKGAVAGVSVVGSSGNTDLDHRVADCYARVAPAVTASLQDDLTQLLTPLPATTK